MLTPGSKIKVTISAAAAAVMLQAGAADADLTNASFSARVADSIPATSLVEHAAASTLETKREALRSESKEIAPADYRSDVAVRGVVLAEIMGSVAALSYFAFLNRRRLRDEIQDRVVHRPTGFDKQDQDFLNELLHSSKSTFGTINRCFDVLAYASVRLDAKEVPIISTKYRLFTCIGGAAGMFAGIGAGIAAESYWATPLMTFGSIAAFAFAMIRVMEPLSERGSRVADQYREWRSKQ